MQIYVVGGAVRNMLMGLPVNDVDYVVVGTTPQEMLSQGFSQVGADFPVFLHPKTGEEYALARTERKNGKGYHGFVTNADPSITLEDDLGRRDLTCNAIAVSLKAWEQVKAGTLNIEDVIIDPFYGYHDIRNKVINPVREETFVEDPLRVLRAARFAAVYHMTWTHQMYQCAATVLNSGELQNIPSERYAAEIEKTLKQCDTAGDIAMFAMIMANLNILPPIHGGIARLKMAGTSLGAKLNELCESLTVDGIKTVFGQHLGMSNDSIAQMLTVRLITELAETSPDDRRVHQVYTVVERLQRAPVAAGWEFAADFANDPHSGLASVWEDILFMRQLFNEVRFETHVPSDTEPKMIQPTLQRARCEEYKKARQ